MADLPSVNSEALAEIKAIAGSADDRPVLMINNNLYVPEANFPNGQLYQDYMAVLHILVEQVGATIKWRTRVDNQVVGDQPLHEILGIWYPSHQSFMKLMTAPASDENMRLRALTVAYANVYRCDPIDT